MNPPQIINTAVLIPQISPGDKENIPLSPHQPLEGWLKQPSWIDGDLNPLHFYITHEEIQRALDAAKLSPSSINPQEHARVSVPPLPVVPAEIIPVPVGVTAAPSSLALTGHLVSVMMVFTAADKSHGGRVAKVVMKKSRSVKSDHVLLDNISPTEFIWIENLAKVTIDAKNIIDSAFSATSKKSNFRGLLVLFVLPKDHMLP